MSLKNALEHGKMSLWLLHQKNDEAQINLIEEDRQDFKGQIRTAPQTESGSRKPLRVSQGID